MSLESFSEHAKARHDGRYLVLSKYVSAERASVSRGLTESQCGIKTAEGEVRSRFRAAVQDAADISGRRLSLDSPSRYSLGLPSACHPERVSSAWDGSVGR
jgi:hypothetical protein